MTHANRGRNAIPFNNSASKTLLENWVEERGVTETLGADARPLSERYRDGHRGLLSTSTVPGASEPSQAACSVGADGTETSRTFTHRTEPHPRTIGRRREDLERQVLAYVVADVQAEELEPAPEMDLTTTTRTDFNPSYVPTMPKDSRPHDVYRESPASFWQRELESGKALTGNSAITSGSSPFKKNATFSTPVELALDGMDR